MNTSNKKMQSSPPPGAPTNLSPVKSEPKEKTLVGGSGGNVTVVCRFRPFNDREKKEAG